jgi:DNA-binding winged helix-turn-helix (wHTH) protein/class 3 adenylate cyclase/tetratricopeptide (TPR) repeat protein
MRYVFGEWTLDTQRAELCCAGRVRRLRRKAFQVLAYLLAHPARVVAKQELCEQVWPQQFISDAALESTIKAVRQAIGDSGRGQRLIQTVYGQGYRFLAAVAAHPEAPVGATGAGCLAPLSTLSPPPQATHDLVLGPSSQGTAGTADGGLETDARGEEASLQRYAPASTGEWKLVTVLCCALAEPSTGAPLELETHYRQLSALYALARDAVQRYGGTLQPVAGEQILALFGAPLAQEEHAQRAVLAALALQRQVREAGSAPSAQPGPRLEVRLGLHTGQVVVGLFEETPEGAGAVVGETLTQARVLQAQAAPGTIRCSRVTARLVHEVVQVAAVAPGPMAGASPLDAAYLVLGQRVPGRLLGPQGARVVTPFIGRTRELATLHALVAQVEEGRGQVVGIIGEPGIGKTRLCAEFIRSQLAQPWCMLDTRAVSYDQAIPYGPIIALLKDYFQLDERDPALAVRDQVTTRLLSLDAALTPLVPALLALLDVPVEDPPWQALAPPQRRQQTFQALKQLLLRASQAQPLLVVLENLHWLDTETQACLDTLVESLPTARLLLLATYRPEHQHGWGHKTYYTQLRLDPLPHQQAHALLDALLGDAAGLGPLKQQVIALTQGNPFFLEESIQTLIETGGIDGARGAYRLVKPLQMIRVPATVQAVLANRLDRLPPEEKRLLQIAAVIGMEVPGALLQALAERSEADLRRSLAHLQAVEFLYETSFFPASAYTFKHALTHEVAYGSLLQEQRRALHGRIVEVLEALSPAQRAEQVERLAHHALRGEVWDKALAYSRQAGDKAMTRSAYWEAVGYFEQALGALQHLPASRAMCERAIDLRLALAFALWRVGGWRRVQASLREAKALAEHLGDQRRLAHVSSELAEGFRLLGDYERALMAGQRALALAVALEDSALQVKANTQLGLIYSLRGDYGRAIEVLRQTVTSLPRQGSRERGDRPDAPLLWPRSWLLLCLSQVGAFAEGRALSADLLRLAETTEPPFRLAIASYGVGLLSLRQGDLCKAIAVLERGLTVCHTHDLRDCVPILGACVGYAYALAGRLPEALTLIEQAVDQYAAMRGGTLFSAFVVWWGEAYLLAGQLDEAYTQAQRGLELSRAHQERGHEAYALSLLGAIAAHRAPPDVDQAEAHYQQALALAKALGMRPLQAHCHLGLGTLYAKTGQVEQAHAALSAAIDLYRAMDMTFWLPQTEASLAQVRACYNTTTG